MWIDHGEIRESNVRVEGLKDRIEFSAEKIASITKAEDDLEGQFQALKTELAAKPGEIAFAARVAQIEASIERLSSANNAAIAAVGGRVSIGKPRLSSF